MEEVGPSRFPLTVTIHLLSAYAAHLAPVQSIKACTCRFPGEQKVLFCVCKGSVLCVVRKEKHINAANYRLKRSDWNGRR